MLKSCQICANATNKRDHRLYCKSLRKWFDLPYKPADDCPFERLESAKELYKNMPNFIGMPDSSLLVGTPAVAVTWIDHSTGERRKVHVSTGRYMHTEDEENGSYWGVDTTTNNRKQMLEWAREDAHYAICAIVGDDRYDWHNRMEENPKYDIVDLAPILIYSSEPDGSSA